jgi:large subunit ribosomal protein L25
MKEISIGATARTSSGKGPARQTRRAGNIPAIMYGPEIDPLPLTINEREFRAALRSASGGGSIFDLNVDGKSSKAIVRDIQRDPVTSNVIHVDLFAISMNKPISVRIPVKYSGLPVGVKTDGGIMQVTMRDIGVSSLPANIPEFLEIDVTELGIGDSLHVRDVEIPDCKITSELRRTMVVISAPTVVKAEVTEEAEGEEGIEGEEGAEGATTEEGPTEGEAAAAAVEAEQSEKKPKKERKERTDRR